MDNKIKELIKESEKYTFDVCSYFSTELGESFSKSSPEMQAWTAECEEFIQENYGKDSPPWRIFVGFDRDELDGNYENDFNDQKGIIVNALTSCLRVKSKNNKSNIKTPVNLKLDKSRVFIVHGHDDEAKIKTARFIEKLGLKPIILHEQASSGKTIIEKIESHTNVGFGIVLYTPCDIGAKNEEPPKLNLRARQNVVFEHGYLIGKIQRENVCALVKGGVETPNDISGVVYVDMDENDAWHFQVAKELKKSGYSIDVNKLL